MTKQDLVDEISRKTQIDKFLVRKTIDSLMETLKESMSKDKNIYLRGFGTFLVKKRAKKVARNISKNTIVVIPARFVPIFKPSKVFKAKFKTKG